MKIAKSVLDKQTPLAEGGEGIIYEYNGQILKIYKPSVNLKEKYFKIEHLMKKNLPKEVIAPIDVIKDNKDSFIGFVMNKIEGEEFKRLSNKKYITSNGITIQNISDMLTKTKNILDTLHSQNIFIGDLNDNNILFDQNFNVYFIDSDSWSIDGIQCDVIMDTFRDHLLVGNNFSQNTDYYAFAILAFKTLTRLHPFGGTMNPDMSILERMKNKISVIDNQKVTVPKNIDRWDFMSPKLIEDLKNIYETNNRFLISTSLDDFNSSLKFCDKHKNYYYSKYNECPICNKTAKIIVSPIKVDTAGKIPAILLFSNNDVKLILNTNSYLSNDKNVVQRFNKKRIKFSNKKRVSFSNDGNIVYFTSASNVTVEINNNQYVFDKLNKSPVLIKDNKLYLINLNHSLVEWTINNSGNFSRNICQAAFNSVFDVYDDKHYFICNIYDDKKIINVDGYNYVISDTNKINDYGIHYDPISENWLFIYENQKGEFLTYIFNKNLIKYEEDKIKYSSELGNLCFYNNTIFGAHDGYITGYNYKKNLYKNFECSVIEEGAKLIKKDKKFIVINEKEIYEIG